jgi:hypothetical protein
MTTITEPHLSVRFQAAMLAAHCKMLAAGMRNSRLPGKAILAKVTQLTGKNTKIQDADNTKPPSQTSRR